MQRHFAAHTILALSLLGSQALAENGKAYPGSACQRQFDHIDASLSCSRAVVLNAGSQAVRLFCPVAKDIEAGRIKRAVVMVPDSHNTQNVTCELMSLGSDGAVVQSSIRQSSATTAVPVALSFGAHKANLRGVYVLTCDLPVDSGPGAGRRVAHRQLYNVVEK
ncbi:MAG: hypothetical protein AB7I59_05015 [Geminicoccaceae bacterium]